MVHRALSLGGGGKLADSQTGTLWWYAVSAAVYCSHDGPKKG